MKVYEALEKLGGLYKERNALYGDNYKHFGKLLLAMFPEGIEINTEDDCNRFALFLHLLTKFSRYSEMFYKGGHPDSLDDISVYSQMLAELDRDVASWKAKK